MKYRLLRSEGATYRTTHRGTIEKMNNLHCNKRKMKGEEGQDNDKDGFLEASTPRDNKNDSHVRIRTEVSVLRIAKKTQRRVAASSRIGLCWWHFTTGLYPYHWTP